MRPNLAVFLSGTSYI